MTKVHSNLFYCISKLGVRLPVGRCSPGLMYHPDWPVSSLRLLHASLIHQQSTRSLPFFYFLQRNTCNTIFNKPIISLPCTDCRSWLHNLGLKDSPGSSYFPIHILARALAEETSVVSNKGPFLIEKIICSWRTATWKLIDTNAVNQSENLQPFPHQQPSQIWSTPWK